MSFEHLSGSGGSGAYQAADPFGYQSAEKLRNNLNLLASGVFGRNILWGGSDVLGITGEATGDVDLPGWFPLVIDNASSVISDSGGTLVCQVRFLVRVSNAAINVTPKIVYGSTFPTFGSTATVSGTAACAATSSDYSGTNQYQTVAVTLPAASRIFKPLLTIAGTPASGYQVYGRAILDLYVQLP
jgi:hypothetical protein